MDLGLTPDHVRLREVAREFVDSEVVPYAAAWDRAESVDRAIIAKLGKVGFLGLTIPEEHGGSGMDHLAYCLALEELGRGDSAVRGLVSVSLGLVAKSLLAYGSAAQKEQWLPKLCSGEALGCFALTEPDTGSDAGNLATRATRDGNGWVLNGSKMFITNGTWADVALVFARTGEPGPRGVTAFAIPTSTAGFIRREVHGKLGLRGQPTAELLFEDVRVADDAVVGDVGRGFKVAMSALDKGRMSVAAGCVGIARGALEASIRYAGERTQFGKPIAGHQLVQEMLADMAVTTDAARLMVWRVADLIDRGQPFGSEASMAKLFASEAAVRVADLGVQVFGGYGYLDEYPVSKYLRDARVMTLYEGTSQIQKLLIGRALTGLNAF
ncbi:acyl-CoA dehydrogenase family protein [Cryptosporangium minutisporangium]|uniref:Acyl-CoA dehydrogenase family protein n=1 Tax=Cryptosporangium minutisporangium TaxID=113569 RepID=A0ABP6T4B7_9ACTN